MVAGCGIGFATGFLMQDMYDFSDQYFQNTFGMWVERLAECSAKNPKKIRIPTTMLPAHLTFLHLHSNSPKTKDPMPSIPSVQFLGAGSCSSEKISRKPTRLWLPSSCVSWSWQGLLQIWQWKPDLSCAHWDGQKERLHMFSRNWAAIMQNEFYKSRALPMNHIRLENLATNQYKL